MLQNVKTYLGKCFAMKDLGEAAYILGIKIYRDRSKRLIGLCQSAYIEKILKRYCMENSKRGSIPMQKKLKLSKSQGASTPAELKRMQNVSYASAVGSIMYVVRCTRPDKSVKQSIFATSSAEAEYIAAFDASKEAVWVRKFISGLSVVPTIKEPISMYCDNTGVIAIANESGITKGARHFRAKVHYLRELVVSCKSMFVSHLDNWDFADPNVEDPNVLPEVLPEDKEDVLPKVSDPNVVMEEVTCVIISLEITCDSAMKSRVILL
nr:retrotransposon protein, putative, Ty1-copia subclass [Tanacetum cinerariifolium]